MPDYQSVSFTWVDLPKPQGVKDRALLLTVKMFVDGSQVVPSAATISATYPSGSELNTAVSDDAVDDIDANGTITHTLAAANLDQYATNYRAHFKMTYSSTVYDYLVLFDIARFVFRNVVVHADLVKHHADLGNLLFSGESDTQAYIELAFEDVYARLESRGKRPYLVLDSESLRRPIEHLALYKFFRARQKNTEDRFAGLADYHLEQFEIWFQTSTFIYDEDESGTADSSDTDATAGEEGSGGGLRLDI